MSFDRKLWEPRFLAGATTLWRCGACDRGYLHANEKLSIMREAAESECAHGHIDWEPEWKFHYFGGLLRCNNSGCGEYAAVAGDTREELEYDEQYGQVSQTYLVPKYLSPAPKMIEMTGIKEIDEQLMIAFGLYWSDASACGNRIRSAIEAAMDHFKVPRSKRTKKGGLSQLMLHGRLLEYEKRNAETAKILLAIKWLGNSASHDALSREDVLDGFELVDHAFAELFRKKTHRIKKLAAAIAKRKGPLRR